MMKSILKSHGGLMAYSPRKVCQTAVVCCIFHNLVLTANLKEGNLGKFGVLLVNQVLQQSRQRVQINCNWERNSFFANSPSRSSRVVAVAF